MHVLPLEWLPNTPGQRFNPSEIAWQSFLHGAEQDSVLPSRLRYLVISHVINEYIKNVIFETTRVSFSTLFLRVSGAMHGRIVGIDETRTVVQQAVQKLDHLKLMNNVACIYSTTHRLDAINELQDAGHVQTTFDIIFARNSLPPPPLSGRHSFATGQPTLLFSKDYGHINNTVADDDFHALLATVGLGVSEFV